MPMSDSPTLGRSHGPGAGSRYDLQLFDERTVAETARIYFGADPAKQSLGLLYASLAEPRELFEALDETGRAEAKATIDAYVRLYAFMSQVMPEPEIALEELYVFCRSLLHVLPADADGSLQLGDELVLTHLRIDETSSGPIQVPGGPLDPGTAFPGGGQGGHSASAMDRLSAVVDQINQRFGLNLDERDQLVFDQFEKTTAAQFGRVDGQQPLQHDGDSAGRPARPRAASARRK
jgi:type I restriction enzyme, R subunit